MFFDKFEALVFLRQKGAVNEPMDVSSPIGDPDIDMEYFTRCDPKPQCGSSPCPQDQKVEVVPWHASRLRKSVIIDAPTWNPNDLLRFL